MNTASILIKTDPLIKAKAQKTAKDLGISLSSIINAFLRQFVKSKTITFSAAPEIPNAGTRVLMRQAQEDYKKGKASPAFKSGKEAIAWLEKQGI